MKKSTLFAGVLSVSLLFSACGSASFSSFDTAVSYGGSKGTVENGAVYEEFDTETVNDAGAGSVLADLTGTEGLVSQNRKLIKNAYMEMQTREFDAFLEQLQQEVDGRGGYVESINVSGGSYYYSSTRYANLVIRVPAGELDGFTGALSRLGHVVSQSESVQDVTGSYLDIESRIAALKTEQGALLALMEKAENMADLLEIQSRLTEVNYQLESYQSSLNRYDDLIAYSTVELSVDEVERVTATEPMSFWDEAKSRLSDSLYELKEGAREFAVSFIGNLPFLLIWAVVILLLVLLAVKLLKKRRSKKASSLPVSSAQDGKKEE